MQAAFFSVPLERLAGNMPFRGLRRPPAVPEVWLPAQCAKGRYLQWLSPLRIFIQRKIKCCFFCFWGMRQPAAVKSRGALFFRPAVSLCLCPAGFAAFPAVPGKTSGHSESVFTPPVLPVIFACSRTAPPAAHRGGRGRLLFRNLGPQPYTTLVPGK